MLNSNWIRIPSEAGAISPVFRKILKIKKVLKRATVHISSIGLYRLYINDKQVGDDILTPGWTDYRKRVQYQTYEVTDLLQEENQISVLCGKGWAMSEIGRFLQANAFADHISIIAEILLEYIDGTDERLVTDESWEVYTSHILDSEIYHGETVDMAAQIRKIGNAWIDTTVRAQLIRQIGSSVKEHERFAVAEIIHTPKGEAVLDFGQNLAGYVEIRIKGKRGDRITLSHAEVLDKNGNFYTENLRKARCVNTYILSGGEDVFKPTFTYQGFRYIRLDEFPYEIKPENFTAIAVYTDMKSIGHFVSGNTDLNQLYSNIMWGLRSNFVDVPTDCPQRDERLGWTADAQVFCRTAAINYHVEDFFDKWLGDLALEQGEDGRIYRFAPFPGTFEGRISAGWSDAAVIVPWELYRAYGSKDFLQRHYNMMLKWVEYMHRAGDEEFLWMGGDHYGDWLALDAGEGQYIGATQTDLIASAFFAYSTSLLIKTEKVLGRDTTYHETLYKNIKAAFRKAFMKNGLPVIYPKCDALSTKRPVKGETQTSIALILHFGLCEDNERPLLAKRLTELIRENGGRMTTGFIGTPYLLHALSDNGYVKEAYDLLFQEKSPSWLFSVKHGATTVWEHWDGIHEDGSFWSKNMNSFNHYAYGAVYDWMFSNLAGIDICEDGAGYTHVTIAPKPDPRVGSLDCGIETKNGILSVKWSYAEKQVRYEISVPNGTFAEIKLPNVQKNVTHGRHCFVSKLH